MLLCILFVGGYPGAHGAGMGGMGGMGGLGNLGSLFQDPELLQAFQVYLQICTCTSHIKLFHVVMKFKDEIALLTSMLVNHVFIFRRSMDGFQSSTLLSSVLDAVGWAAGRASGL